ncbi:hypothetical protein GEMRC1_003816 [Eukaryota sp. GEM-RC1]
MSTVEPPLKKSRPSGRFEYLFIFLFQIPGFDLEFFSHKGTGSTATKAFFEEAFGIVTDGRFGVNGAEMNIRTTNIKYLKELVHFCSGHPSFAELETLVAIRRDLRDNVTYCVKWRSSYDEDYLKQFLAENAPDLDPIPSIVDYYDEELIDELQREANVHSRNLNAISTKPVNGKGRARRRQEKEDQQLSLLANGPPAVKRFFTDAFGLQFGSTMELQGTPFSIKSNNLQYLVDFANFASLYEPFNLLSTFLVVRQNHDTLVSSSLLLRSSVPHDVLREKLKELDAPHDAEFYNAEGEVVTDDL